MRLVLVAAFAAAVIGTVALVNVGWAADTSRPTPGQDGVIGVREGVWAATSPHGVSNVHLARCTGIHVLDAPAGALDRVRTTDGEQTVWIPRDALLPSNRAAGCGCRTHHAPMNRGAS